MRGNIKFKSHEIAGKKMIPSENMLFVGGYTKSGTTFVGRCLSILKGVAVFGELDYFRVCYPKVNDMLTAFNRNIRLVNDEVYDGLGSISALNSNHLNLVHQKLFWTLIAKEEPLPPETSWLVEKSPRNIFYVEPIKRIFPGSKILSVYRRPDHVFRSLVRHMSDNRDKNFSDPDFVRRKTSLTNFAKRWNLLSEIIEKRRKDIFIIQYAQVVEDTESFFEFAQTIVFQQAFERTADLESLSKKAYLAKLPAEKREKSLVQTGPYKIKLTQGELDFIETNCRIPDITFDF